MYVLKLHAQSLSRVWLCDTVNCSPPGSSVYGIAQAKMLEWVAISSSRGSSWPRDPTCISCIGRWILHHWATWEVLNLTLKGVFNTPYFLSVTYVFLHAVLSSEMPAFSFRFHFYFYLRQKPEYRKKWRSLKMVKMKVNIKDIIFTILKYYKRSTV